MGVAEAVVPKRYQIRCSGVDLKVSFDKPEQAFAWVKHEKAKVEEGMRKLWNQAKLDTSEHWKVVDSQTNKVVTPNSYDGKEVPKVRK
jgi:hypothetical protein